MKRLQLSKERLTTLSDVHTQSAKGGTGFWISPTVGCLNQVTQNPFVCYLVPVPALQVINTVLDGPRPNPW